MTISLTTCPSNLKEAVDWILRVTGKDGQVGGDNGSTYALTEKVKNLLSEVKGSGSGLGAEFEKVMSALAGGPNGLITKLADGLQKFIGYDAGSNGKITGGGILPANVARHQVCNAVLNFVIRFLEELLGIKASGHGEALKVIGKLRKCVGTGQVPQGFGKLMEEIRKKVQTGLTSLKDNAGRSLKEVFDNLKTVVQTASLENGSSGSVQSSNINNFLVDVFGKVNGERSAGSFAQFTKLCTQLAKLFNENNIKSGLSTSSSLQDSALNGKIKAASNAATVHALTLEIDKLRYKSKNPIPAALLTAVQSAAQASVGDRHTKKYTSYYNGVDNKDVGNVQCAKIFLSCLPLYYHALTYLYWRCD
ncbi:variant erythrocyte surface antigen- beta subunit [Babesia caballi]|uniref:Variant erythrocyte surface antigen- beta subunit n=1 Tax=Babesia caballi TaxID=5871 RepID=A0AAV4LTQ2_BABCB|nr:variant erythrocyte surface antigen- beta subunit [Babesia caballi]